MEATKATKANKETRDMIEDFIISGLKTRSITERLHFLFFMHFAASESLSILLSKDEMKHLNNKVLEKMYKDNHER